VKRFFASVGFKRGSVLDTRRQAGDGWNSLNRNPTLAGRLLKLPELSWIGRSQIQ